jgi:hypothetical protein
MKYLYLTRVSEFDMLTVGWTYSWDGRMESDYGLLVK